MKFKPGDIVETDRVYRVVKTALHRINLNNKIQLEVIKATKTVTFSSSYVVKNLKTGKIEKTQYWEDELTLVR